MEKNLSALRVSAAKIIELRKNESSTEKP